MARARRYRRQRGYGERYAGAQVYEISTSLRSDATLPAY
eukprot:SAG11_NODE_34375_length_272_cov_0.861272_1_plen_38_part_10